MLKIDIGGGKNPKQGFQCLDIIEDADIQMDIEQDDLPFANHSVDEYYTNHTFEHIHNIIHVMNEVFRTLKEGGTIEIRVPHICSKIAWADPTHCRYWLEDSFKYFTGAYLEKYQLDYGIACCFKLLSMEVLAPDNRPEYFQEIRVILQKNKKYVQDIDYIDLNSRMNAYFSKHKNV